MRARFALMTSLVLVTGACAPAGDARDAGVTAGDDAGVSDPHDAGPAADGGAPADDAGPSVGDGGSGGEMARVPAGAFTMGCDDCDADEAPAHEVTLSAFEIDLTEVTQAAYEACVTASACTEPSAGFEPAARGSYPVVNVTWQQASEYCAFVGKRLPTEAEWEKAARGTDGRTWPWGEAETDCSLAITDACGGDAFPVGTAALGASPYGVLDMAGNVWEWTADYYDESAYAAHAGADPTGPATGTSRVYRGGSAGNHISLARASNRASTYNPAVGGSGLGFRCAR